MGSRWRRARAPRRAVHRAAGRRPGRARPLPAPRPAHAGLAASSASAVTRSTGPYRVNYCAHGARHVTVAERRIVEGGLAGGRAQQRREMGAGGLTCRSDAVGIDAVLRSVRPQPADRRFHVEQLCGEHRLTRQPVVDARDGVSLATNRGTTPAAYSLRLSPAIHTPPWMKTNSGSGGSASGGRYRSRRCASDCDTIATLPTSGSGRPGLRRRCRPLVGGRGRHHGVGRRVGEDWSGGIVPAARGEQHCRSRQVPPEPTSRS